MIAIEKATQIITEGLIVGVDARASIVGSIAVSEFDQGYVRVVAGVFVNGRKKRCGLTRSKSGLIRNLNSIVVLTG